MPDPTEKNTDKDKNKGKAGAKKADPKTRGRGDIGVTTQGNSYFRMRANHELQNGDRATLGSNGLFSPNVSSPQISLLGRFEKSIAKTQNTTTFLYSGLNLGFGQKPTTKRIEGGFSQRNEENGLRYRAGAGYELESKALSARFLLRATKLPWDMQFDGRGNYSLTDHSINASAVLSKKVNETIGVMIFDRYNEKFGNQIGAGITFNFDQL